MRSAVRLSPETVHDSHEGGGGMDAAARPGSLEHSQSRQAGGGRVRAGNIGFARAVVRYARCVATAAEGAHGRGRRRDGGSVVAADGERTEEKEQVARFASCIVRKQYAFADESRVLCTCTSRQTAFGWRRQNRPRPRVDRPRTPARFLRRYLELGMLPRKNESLPHERPQRRPGRHEGRRPERLARPPIEGRHGRNLHVANGVVSRLQLECEDGGLDDGEQSNGGGRTTEGDEEFERPGDLEIRIGRERRTSIQLEHHRIPIALSLPILQQRYLRPLG
mmetsp:Transcript_27532/g.50127  ORF Transcript_27532/g.50127 Transcript_27532/m.50127 type:complete len:279 (+) Transcript_27532:1232-2068(+)